MTVDLLSPEDLAYLRETQAEARPTAALLFTGTAGTTSDGMGGRVANTDPDGEPIQVRIVQVSDRTAANDVPEDLASRYAASLLVRIVTDLVPIPIGSRIHDLDRNRWYDVVSAGEAQEWTTAQDVWAARGTAP